MGIYRVTGTWICGHCYHGHHRRCPGMAGCSCAGLTERICECALYGHPARVIDLRDSVLAAAAAAAAVR